MGFNLNGLGRTLPNSRLQKLSHDSWPTHQIACVASSYFGLRFHPSLKEAPEAVLLAALPRTRRGVLILDDLGMIA
jgi:hypothetical protein